MNVSAANDVRLSVKAKGVMYYLVSKPDGWKGHVYDIVANTSSGRKTVQSSLKELSTYGYVELIKERDSNGFITSYYRIYDESKKK